MAVYEPESDRIVVRVVYDGPGRAGKTTNVEQLARIFDTRPGNELQVYGAAGRAILFDWFSFDGGVLDGHRLQVQVVTVPNRRSLEPQRAHILHTADAVVLVCDSARAGLDAVFESLAGLRGHLARHGAEVPLVVQANKQDLPDVLLPHELGGALGMSFEVPVLAAQASAGIGVRETVIHAIRAAVRQLKRRTAGVGLAAITGRAGTAEELRAALPDFETTARPTRRAEDGRVVYLRQRAASGPEPAARPRPTAPRPYPSPLTDRPGSPAANSPASPDGRPPSGAEGHAPADSPAPTTGPVLTDRSAPATGPVPPDSPNAAAEPVPEDIAAALARPPDEPAPDAPAPAAPRPNVPSGHVWPVPGGRRLLERLAGRPLEPAPRPRGSPDLPYHAAGLCLRTRPQWRYPDVEAGREALLLRARGLARLGALLPTDLAVALAADPDGAALWHITPRLPALDESLREAPADTRVRLLARLAAAHAAALRLAARDDLVLSFALRAWSEQDGRIVYTATDLDDRARIPDLAARLLAALAGLGAAPSLLLAYTDGLARALPDTLTRDDAAALDLLGGLEAAADDLARARVLAAVRACA